MELIERVFVSDNYVIIGVAFSLAALLWFLPALLALIFNRKHFKLILFACIPAGFSLVAWSGLLIWAITGKVAETFSNREDSRR